MNNIKIVKSDTENPLRNFYERYQKIYFIEQSSIIDKDITKFLKEFEVKIGLFWVIIFLITMELEFT